jgi:hypothetical protein
MREILCHCVRLIAKKLSVGKLDACIVPFPTHQMLFMRLTREGMVPSAFSRIYYLYAVAVGHGFGFVGWMRGTGHGTGKPEGKRVGLVGWDGEESGETAL